MTAEVPVASPDQTFREAAQAMAELDAGVLPVGENDSAIRGILSLGDIAKTGVLGD
jgi:CBS domain-containing protein